MAEKNGASRYVTLTNEMLEAFSALSYYSPLPGERELGELFGVSRPTVRKALKTLEDQRKVIRIQGKGSFYLGNKRYLDHDKSTTGIAFCNEMLGQDGYLKSKIITQNIEPAETEIAEKLHIDEKQQIFHLERLFTMSGQYRSLVNSYMPYAICPDLLHVDFANSSLYSILENSGVHPYRVEQVLETAVCEEYEARHLGIDPGEPVSLMQTITYDESGRVIEYACSKAPAYKTRYEMTYYIGGQAPHT